MKGENNTISVVLSADDGYARPLTTAARSVIDVLKPERSLEIYVLDMGITPANRRQMEASLAHERVRVQWVRSLTDRVQSLPNTWAVITRATYARLFIAT